MGFNLAWRLFRHEARRGELSIILMAIVLSVAAVLSLSLFSERLQQALTERSSEFLAADRVLSSGKPVDEQWLLKADEYSLNQARETATRSMAFANGELMLADVYAVDQQYPLKGKVKVADKPFEPGQVIEGLPASGEVWAESRLLQVLGIGPGDSLEIGDASFKVAKVLVEIPDRGFSIFGGEPIVLMPMADLASTNIIGPGSRQGYHYMFTGAKADLDSFYQWLEPQLNDELHRWRSIEDDESPIGRAVGRAEEYFLLASLLAIVLASVSIAVAAQRYSQRHYDPVAIMKTLGASRQLVQKVYLLQILFITLLGIALGTLAGFILQQTIAWLVAGQVEVSLSAWHWRPFFIAVFTGLVCASLFSLYPLLKLFSIPPLRVLRRDMDANLRSRLLQFAAAGGAILLLMWAYSGKLKLSLILFASGILLVLALMLVTVLLIRVGRKLGQGRIGAWQLAWARIRRRSMDNSVQLISFAITIMLLLVVLVMRNDMVKQWREQLPQGTPNYFLINIPQAQLPELQEHFTSQNVQTQDYFPVVRGRLAAINDESVRTSVSKEEENADDSGRRGLGREANLTWSHKLQYENRIVAGEWLTEHQPGEPYGVSVEQEVAERLQLELGDVLHFNIGSEQVAFTITSLREVNWQTMQPNFYFILQPEAMAEFSPTYITSFHLPAERKAELSALMAPFASLTLFDVDARINQLRNIVDQVSMAVEFILVLVLFAGSLVLIAQVQASMDERQRELAILRTLGAKGQMIRASVILEFVIIGVVAGVMAALANEFALYLLQSQVFNMPGQWHFEYWLIAPAVGALVVGVLGGISCRRLLSSNTGHLLRQMV